MPSASHSGIGTPAPDTATIPSPYNQYNQGSHSTTAQQPFITGMVPADTTAPAVLIYTPAPIVPKIDAEFINARFGLYVYSGKEEGF